jgi:hypothetical protein
MKQPPKSLPSAPRVLRKGVTMRRDGRAMSTPYEASRLRRRATPDEMRERSAALLEIVGESPPMTARQAFYLATVRGIVEKTEAVYDRIQRQLVALRMTGALPFEWIADHTRWQRRPRTFDTPADALSETARFYRKSLWSQATDRVEVWLEKDALAGVVVEVTCASDVPLMVTRGYPSLTFLASAAQTIVETARPTFIYHLGDFDPSGQDAARVVEERLRSLACGTNIRFERLAVTPTQIRELDLPTRPTKTSDSRAKHFGSVSVELDAIHPDTLRSLVSDAIERHLPRRQLQVMKVAEASEREWLARVASTFVRGDRR